MNWPAFAREKKKDNVIMAAWSEWEDYRFIGDDPIEMPTRLNQSRIPK